MKMYFEHWENKYYNWILWSHFGRPVFWLKLGLKARTIMPTLFSAVKYKPQNLFYYVWACFLVHGIQGNRKNVNKYKLIF